MLLLDLRIIMQVVAMPAMLEFMNGVKLHWTGYQVGADIDGEAAGRSCRATSVSISSDGSRVAIGAPWNDGNGSVNTGHVRIYEWSEIVLVWEQVGADIDGEAASDASGYRRRVK